MIILICTLLHLLFMSPAVNYTPADNPAFRSLLTVPVQALLVSDDDGTRPARATAEEFKTWIDFANRAFRRAKVRFEFKPEYDWDTLHNTVINNITGTSDSNWIEARSLGNKIAAEYPGKIVVFIRHGPESQPSGGGFSWCTYDFVAMGGFANMNHCGHSHIDALAHEIGHYFGLQHTFSGGPLPDVAAAESRLTSANNDPNVFDGDGFTDTLPDPCISSLECRRIPEITLNGRKFRLPRTNLMSYYDERVSLSVQQINRVRWILEKRIANKMATLRNSPGSGKMEAENLRILNTSDCSTTIQNMKNFGPGNWSNQAQLFCGAQKNGTITLELPVTESTTYQLIVYATLAPDFGIIECRVDEKQTGKPQDLYYQLVLPSGPLDLGEIKLSKGTHQITFTATKKHTASTGYKFGIDAIELHAKRTHKTGTQRGIGNTQ